MAQVGLEKPHRQDVELLKEGIKDSRGRKKIPEDFKDMPVPSTDNPVKNQYYKTGSRCKICNQYSLLRGYIEEMLVKGISQKKIVAWANHYGADITEMNLSEHKKRHFRMDEMIATETQKRLPALIEEVAADNVRSLSLIIERGLEAIAEKTNTPTPGDTTKAIKIRADISGETPLSQYFTEVAKSLAKKRQDEEAEEIEAEIIDEPERDTK